MSEENIVQGEVALFTISEPRKFQMVRNVEVERVEIKLTRDEIRWILINYLLEFPEARKVQQDGFKFEDMREDSTEADPSFDNIAFIFDRIKP